MEEMINESRFESYSWFFFKSYIERYHRSLELSYLEFSGTSKNGTQRIYGYDEIKGIFWCIYLDEFNSSELESTYRYLQSLSSKNLSFSTVYLFASQHKTSEMECLRLSEMIAHLNQGQFQTHLMGYRFCETEQHAKIIALQEFIVMQPKIKKGLQTLGVDGFNGIEASSEIETYSFLNTARLNREELRDFIDFELDYKMLNL
jgi:hypothetical protein